PFRSSPVATSKSRTRPQSPIASILPSGKKSTGPVAFHSRATRGGAVVRFHNLTLGSRHADADASFLLSGENARETTASAWPWRLARSCPVVMSQSFSRPTWSPFRLYVPAAKVLPSGEKARDRIAPAPPLKMAFSLHVFTSYNFMLPSAIP